MRRSPRCCRRGGNSGVGLEEDVERRADAVDVAGDGVALEDFLEPAPQPPRQGVRFLGRSAGRHLFQTGDAGRGGPRGPRRLDDDRGDLAILCKDLFEPADVVGRRRDEALPDLRRHPERAVGVERRLEAVHDAVVPAVEVALEAEHLVPPCERPGEAQGKQRRFGTGVDEPHLVGRRDQLLDDFTPLHVQRVVVAEVGAVDQGALDRLDDGRMRVPQKQGAVAQQEVDVLVAVHVPLAAPFAPGDVHGNRFEVADIVADRAPQCVDGARVQGRRLPPRLGVGLKEIAGL